MSLVKRQKIDQPSDKLTQSVDTSNDQAIAISLEGHDGPVITAKFSHNGFSIASGGADKSILLWKIPSGQDQDEYSSSNYGILTGHKSAVTSVKWSYDDSIIISASADTTVGIWNTTTGQRIRKFTSHDMVVNEVDISPEEIILSVSDDSSACLWDIRERDAINKINTQYPLLTGTFNNNGSHLFISGIDPSISCYDIRQLDKVLWTCPTKGDSITSLSVNNDDSILLARSMNGNLITCNAKPQIPKGTSRISPHSFTGASILEDNIISRACFSNDSMKILSSSTEDVLVWQLTTRKIIGRYSGHKGSITDIDYHSTRSLYLSCSLDKTIIVRELDI